VSVIARGGVRKMVTALADPVQYALPLGETETPMNALLGRSLQLTFSGAIHCIYCGRKTSKSFNQGYCFPCFKRLARCDSCIVSPEKCHFHEGTCREPEWGLANCMIEHVVYLANTSGLKVGITRGSQVPTRWMDQGATQALPLYRVATRLHSGLVEVVFARHIADRTNWQAMLKGPGEERDLAADAARLTAACSEEVAALRQTHGEDAIEALPAPQATAISYPVLSYPDKVRSFNLDKQPVAAGTLLGIKGQYLIFDTGVINMRKYGGYDIELSSAEEF
jgi:hypothetical protein